MTREECAAELYNLVVNRGRWQDKPRGDSLFGDSFAELPEFMQEMWLDEADRFAKSYTFKFKEN